MRSALVIVILVGCWSGGAAPPPPKPTPTPLAIPTDAPRVGCQDTHGCKLQDVCGCSCNGVLLSAPKLPPCEESCPNKNACAGYTLMCDMSSGTCGALPPPP